ncbi:hypothetical protein J4E91_000951 [Alternaria rosae]|nr:hypothetical protein J4E91_000951 [Alternaria rosae]
MAALVTQKQILEMILTDCANHYSGDPIAKLKSLPENCYTNTKTMAANKGWPTALAAIEEAFQIKPKGQHPLCRIRMRAAPHTKNGRGTYVSSVAACMHDYPFNEANKDDPSADADMVLTGPATEISFRRRPTAPARPALPAGTMEALLAVAGAEFTEKGLDDLIVRHMGLQQQKFGKLGWAQAFEDILGIMRGRWHSNVVTDYKSLKKKVPGDYVGSSPLLTAFPPRKRHDHILENRRLSHDSDVPSFFIYAVTAQDNGQGNAQRATGRGDWLTA